MKIAVTLFLFLFFLPSLSCCNSMQMLSIENGKVYTERYSLCHILNITTKGSSQILSDSLQSFNSNRMHQHSHVVLTKSCLHEEQDIDNIILAYNTNLDSNLSITSSNLFAKHHKLHNKPIKIPPLLQTTVLLI
jgi:hypothetical protein